MQKAPLTFRLYQIVKFNRPIDKVKDYISPGGYTFKVKDRKGKVHTISFDFCESEGHIEDSPKLFHCMQKEPDYESFKDLDILDEYMLQNIISVEEWFIFTGDPEDIEGDTEPLKPVKIIEPVIEIIPPKGNIIQIPIKAKIIPTCNFSDE